MDRLSFPSTLAGRGPLLFHHLSSSPFPFSPVYACLLLSFSLVPFSSLLPCSWYLCLSHLFSTPFSSCFCPFFPFSDLASTMISHIFLTAYVLQKDETPSFSFTLRPPSVTKKNLTPFRSQKWQVTNTASGTVTELTETTTSPAFYSICPTSTGVTWASTVTCSELLFLSFLVKWEGHQAHEPLCSLFSLNCKNVHWSGFSVAGTDIPTFPGKFFLLSKKKRAFVVL